jgi:hypothetical protein
MNGQTQAVRHESRVPPALAIVVVILLLAALRGHAFAISTRMLEIRTPEINALVTLKKANDAAILAGGAVNAFGDMFTGAVTTVTNPVETLEAVPAGLNRMFGFAGREVKHTEEKIDANAAATRPARARAR